MKKEDFIKLLEQAKTDENGRLYLDGLYGNKVYFGLITTICEDIFDEHNCEDDEIYDRHWWNDDTLEIRVVSKHKFDINEMVKNNEKED